MNAQKEMLRSVGNCELLEKIADSGVAAVYKARNRAGDIVAVKVMPPFEADKEQVFQRFARECRILSGLNDPHIVRALDFGIDGADAYLVMEFVEGESLADRVERAGGLPEAEAVGLIAEVAGALDRAHRRGLVHRNIKPDKILITPEGKIKLTDLGLVRPMDTEALTRAGTILGTPNYMAPEQLSNASKATPRCDIYSLAATLYTAVTGKVPFAGCKLADMWARKMCSGFPPAKKLVPTLSARLDRAIHRAMSPEPQQRPATCAEFIADLTAGDEPEAQTKPAQPAADRPLPQPAPLPVLSADAESSAHLGALPSSTTPEPSDPAKSDDAGLSWGRLLGYALLAVALLLCALVLLAT